MVWKRVLEVVLLLGALFLGGLALGVETDRVSLRTLLQVLFVASVLRLAANGGWPAVREALERIESHRLVVPVLVIGSFLLLARIKLSYHARFQTNAHDLLVYKDALDSAFGPVPLYSRWEDASLLERHAHLVLFLLVPVYRLSPGPILLLLLQAAFTALALWPLFRLTRRLLAPHPFALAICFAFLGNPHLGEGFLFDFKHEILAPPLLFTAFLALDAGRMKTFWTSVALILLCREDFGIFLAAFGLWLAFDRARRRTALTLFFVATAASAIAIWAVIPAFKPPDLLDNPLVAERWGNLGKTKEEVLVALISRPGFLADRMLGDATLRLLLPFFLIPLLSPLTWIVLPPFLFINTTSADMAQSDLALHYPLPVLPYLFLGLLHGLRTILRRAGDGAPRLACFLALALVWHNVPEHELSPLSPRQNTLHGLIQGLPPDARVASQDKLLPHLEGRVFYTLLVPAHVGLGPGEIANPESWWTRVLPRRLLYEPAPVDHLLVDLTRPASPMSRDELRGALDRLVATGRARTLHDADDIVLLALEPGRGGSG